MRSRTLALVPLALVLLGVLLAPAAWATDEPLPDTEETIVVETFDGAEPVIVIEPEALGDDEPAWTFRYLVPTFLVLTLIGVVVTFYRWYQLRSKYEVVD